MNENDVINIRAILSTRNIPRHISNDVIDLIANCNYVKVKWLSLEYLAVAGYILVINMGKVDYETLVGYSCYIDDSDNDLVCRTLYRYCMFILRSLKS
jgi:hypothetical protein